MSIDRDDDREQIAEAIMGYLKNHPNAADTVDGITQWWLPSQHILVSSARVQRTLDHLVSRSQVKFKINLSGNKVYSIIKPE